MASRKRSAERFYLPPLSLACAVWKRKIALCAIFVVGCAITAGIALKWPPTYKSQAVILVESQRIPQAFVTATVNQNLRETLSSLSERILAYSRLLTIIKKYDLYAKQRRKLPEEKIIEMMRSDIDIELDNSWSKDHPGAFTISYQGRVPTTVAMVTNELANLFIEDNLRSREMQAMGTSQFLDNQLADAKSRLEQQEAMLSKYKLAHQGELPEQEKSMLANLNRLQVELEGVQDGLNRAQQNNILIQDSLQSGEITLASMVRIAQEKSTGSGAAAAAPGDQPTSVPQLEAKLTNLETQYTDDYPEVQKVKALLAAARSKDAKLQAQDQSIQKKSAKTAQPLPPGVSNLEIAEIDDPTVAATLAKERERLADLKAQKAVIAKQIVSYNDQRKKILAQIESVQARVDHLPVTEQQLASVTRDYQITKANYKSLLDKKLAAGMAADMEKRQKSEHFALLDPARVPQIPFKPNRPLVLAVGGFLSLLIAAAFVLGRAVQENMILGDWELPKDVPILGHVPVIPAVAAARRSRFSLLRRKAAGGAAVALLVLAGIAGLGASLGMGIYLHWI